MGSPDMSTSHLVTLHILLLLLLGVEGDLLPGDETEFSTKAGYKYSGTDDDQVTVELGDGSNSNTLCGHRCLLDNTCTAFYMDGSSSNLITSLTNNTEKDGVTNNVYLKGVAT